MNTNILNLDLVKDQINSLQVIKLEAGASMHKRFSNITFEVLDFKNGELFVITKQGKSHEKNYASKELLKIRTKQLFEMGFPKEQKINIEVVPYKE